MCLSDYVGRSACTVGQSVSSDNGSLPFNIPNSNQLASVLSSLIPGGSSGLLKELMPFFQLISLSCAPPGPSRGWEWLWHGCLVSSSDLERSGYCFELTASQCWICKSSVWDTLPRLKMWSFKKTSKTDTTISGQICVETSKLWLVFAIEFSIWRILGATSDV